MPFLERLPIVALIEALHYERQGISIQNLVRQFAAAWLAELGPTIIL
jgi:hypothetical protein